MYKLSKELDEAIQSVFEDPDQGYAALALDSDEQLKNLGLQRKKNVSTDICPLKRVSLFRRLLENWVELKGREIHEFEGEYDLTRIRYEAYSTLMVLRDLQTYFPEVETATREELQEVELTL